MVDETDEIQCYSGRGYIWDLQLSGRDPQALSLP